MRFSLHLVVTITVGLVGSACSDSLGEEGEVVGIVTEVTGDLTGVESFVVLDADGDSFKFKPRDGMLVMGQQPSHLRDHVISGEPVTVAYYQDASGELIADEVTGEMSS
jgi:hypothetical protein